MSLVLALLACQVLDSRDLHSLRFANGSTLTYGLHHPPTVLSPKGAQEIDLKAYLARRIAERTPGNPDKSANNLTAHFRDSGGAILPYLVQAFPIGRDQALGIIGFSPTNFMAAQDIAHDLVMLTVGTKPTVTRLRSVETTWDHWSAPAEPRLFRSRGDLLLRRFDGFEVIDAKGVAKRRIPFINADRMVGFNAAGDLVMSFHDPEMGIAVFNLPRQSGKLYPMTGARDLENPSADYRTRDPRTVVVIVHANKREVIGTKEFVEGVDREYLIDALTGRTIRVAPR